MTLPKEKRLFWLDYRTFDGRLVRHAIPFLSFEAAKRAGLDSPDETIHITEEFVSETEHWTKAWIFPRSQLEAEFKQ